MKIQADRLNKAIELLDRDIEIKGAGLRYFIKKTQWTGDRYSFLLDLDKICGHDGYDYNVFDDYVCIEIIGSENSVISGMLCLHDSYF